MVAKGGRVVSNGIVSIDDGFALPDVGKQAALHLVTHVHHQQVIRANGGLHHVDRVCQARQPRVAARGFKLAMEIVMMQDGKGNVARRRSCGGLREQPENQQERR